MHIWQRWDKLKTIILKQIHELFDTFQNNYPNRLIAF